MKKPMLSLTAIFIILAFLASCITAPTFLAPIPTNEPAGTVMARIFPEITLVTKNGRAMVGKITCLKEEVVEFRPSPYWNVEALAIPLDDLDLIFLPKTSGGAGRGFLNGFGFAYAISGFLGTAYSKYNSDYSGSLIMSFINGLAWGAVGAIIGAVGSAASAKEIKMRPMDRSSKAATVRGIMGR